MSNQYGQPRKQPEGVAAMRELMGRYRRGARNRGIPFLLTEVKFKDLTSSNCHYCGAYPKQRVFTETQLKRKRSNGNYAYNGIDRLNNDLGYFFENCLPCCTTCNLGKYTQSYDDFIAYLAALTAYRRNLS